jgi:hypothetical protein
MPTTPRRQPAPQAAPHPALAAAPRAGTDLPPIGSHFAGGLYAGIVTAADSAPYALILLPDKPAKRLAWQPAKDWATTLNATLPNRVEGALLFANLGSHFEPYWHWLETQYSESSAWNQDFGYGYQYGSGKKYEARARAVRRLVLQSFNASVVLP